MIEPVPILLCPKARNGRIIARIIASEVCFICVFNEGMKLVGMNKGQNIFGKNQREPFI